MEHLNNHKDKNLIKNLKRQLFSLIESLHDEGFSQDEVSRFIIEVIFQSEISQQGCNNYAKGRKMQVEITRNDLMTFNSKKSLVEQIMDRINIQKGASKLILKYIENCFCQIHNLNQQFLAVQSITESKGPHIFERSTLTPETKRFARKNAYTKLSPFNTSQKQPDSSDQLQLPSIHKNLQSPKPSQQNLQTSEQNYFSKHYINRRDSFSNDLQEEDYNRQFEYLQETQANNPSNKLLEMEMLRTEMLKTIQKQNQSKKRLQEMLIQERESLRNKYEGYRDLLQRNQFNTRNLFQYRAN